MTGIYANSIKDQTGTRQLASDSGSAWSWGSSVPKGSVIEQFCSPCDGSSITVQSGTYTVETVSAVQTLSLTHTKIEGSQISYTPPTGTQTVVYEFNFFASKHDDTNAMFHVKATIAGADVDRSRTTFRSSDEPEGRHHMMWAFGIGSDVATTGRVATWTSANVINLKARDYSSGFDTNLHETLNWDGSSGTILSMPIIKITALA